MSLILTEREGGIARVWLNRPDAHNALSPDLGAAIVEAFGALAGDASVRCVVLGGKGPSFCAGADLGVMKASANASYDENFAEAQRLGEVFEAVANFPRPVVGRVHGGVYGGGVGLVSACDIVVAADDTKFAFTEVRLGIVPALISPYVLRRLGDRAARELMLTGERFDAATALRAGLANHVVPAAELDAAVAGRAAELLQGAPGAQGRVKALLARWSDAHWEDFRSGLPRALAEARATGEARDGLAAFFEKRPPGWRS